MMCLRRSPKIFSTQTFGKRGCDDPYSTQELKILTMHYHFLSQVQNLCDFIFSNFWSPIFFNNIKIQNFVLKNIVNTRRLIWANLALELLRAYLATLVWVLQPSWRQWSTSSGSKWTIPNTSKESLPQNFLLYQWWSPQNIYSTMEQVILFRFDIAGESASWTKFLKIRFLKNCPSRPT